ncbi:3-oxo-5-alpha-steroid 4-dehydrogenase 1-like [Lineus longissimus]|uniref:3-oxo-5-alpha-steroid 4-dehydrogenase 1-like n=1 Tax=Lineus longissimus TaxID=88925 RepID=UPI002B4D18C3
MAATMKQKNFLENFLQNEQFYINVMSYVIIAMGILVNFILHKIPAPYGRYNDGSTKWGFQIDGKVGWILQELPALLVPFVCLLIQYKNLPFTKYLANYVLLALFMCHYVQRCVIFPLLIRGGKPSPFVTVFMAFIYCMMNGYIQGRTLTKYADFPPEEVYSPRFMAGCFFFLCGMLINLHSDHLLRNLRKPGETGYKIPRGGMFEYVSGANFFGEIVEWMGFAIACWNLPALSFFIFTFCNLVPRGIAHHKSYLKKFENYPKNRKAVIPFLC